jgi:serine beta-lactamase-like protein LACTB, mitochondrial
VAKSWNRIETWLTLVVGGIGLVILGVAGLWVYVSATATPLHPSAQDVPSVAPSAPSSKWGSAAEQGRQIVRATLSEQNWPGLSVAVGAGSEIVWAEGFGFADLEKRVKVEPDTRFRIGTASTALTSAAVGLLLEKGALTLDDPVQKHVPEFPAKPWPVTLRQVMAHTAGLSSDGGDEGPMFGQHCDRPVDGLKEFADRDLRFEPGTEFRNSDYGWILVSAAIEAAAGEPFLIFMRKQVFEPLGMENTAPDFAKDVAADRAISYFPRFAADPRYGPDIMRDIDLSCYAGASAFLSTPSDLVRFAQAISNGKLLTPATVQLLQTSPRLPSGHETGYGLGWDLETVDVAGKQTRVVGHDGEVLGGMAVSLQMFPEYGVVVAVASNISYADTFALGVKIVQAFVEQGKYPKE